ncbi:MAG: ComEC family competence protein [Chitinophagaceae bacterium]|nr:ComEC family competence protein [Chitinophagaceae bacterium]
MIIHRLFLSFGVAAQIYLWHRAPFVRLIIPLIAGTLLQWHLQLQIEFLIAGLVICVFLFVGYFFFPTTKKFQFRTAIGIVIMLLICFLGAVLTWFEDIRHDNKWIGNQKIQPNYILATVEEPLIEKPNSYKALASVKGFFSGDTLHPSRGKIILYFKKDSSSNSIEYGSQLIIARPLQQIRNSGNPGGFDYKRYSLFQGITHQVFLSGKNFTILDGTDKKLFLDIIYRSRSSIVTILKRNIPGEKEQGLAEALLIGYKDDLDKNLVQSYTNTGVVHIIAISGLHLGLIYWLLLIITKPLRRKKFNWLRIIIILSSLWLFSILAGAQPSVLRSAVMFTFIALAEVSGRKTSVYNTLALSAFILLCINPFWLWDVGFQLSYAAVLSIFIFFKPIYNWIYLPNKAIDFIWKLNAVTLAAQILTVPISIYHFHQFPVLFFLTNLVAVPLSSIILIGEILLCSVFFITTVAKILGIILQNLIYFMNTYIERLENVSFALWNGLYITTFQTVLMILFITGVCYWLMEKKRNALWFGLASFLVFIVLRSISFSQAYHQKKLIVYNVPKHQSIDLIAGRVYSFVGDTELLHDGFIRNFHLQPSRIIHRISQKQFLPVQAKTFNFLNKKVLIIDTSVQFKETTTKPVVDLIVLSKNPKLYISAINKTFQIKQIVIDGSVPAWKARYWKSDCDSLHIPYHDVSEKGAFVMNFR